MSLFCRTLFLRGRPDILGGGIGAGEPLPVNDFAATEVWYE